MRRGIARIENVLEDQTGGVDLAIPESKSGAQLIAVEMGFKFADSLLIQSAMMAIACRPARRS